MTALADDDLAHMRKVHGHVQRPLAREDGESSRWRYLLMNWGHDPLEEG
jgi:hypothetical protein